MQNFENVRPLKIKHIYTAFEACRDVGFYFGGEIHNFWECVCVIKGTAGITADDRVYTLNEGDVIFHKPMEFHQIWNDGDSPLELFIVSFDADSPMLNKLEEKTCRFNETHKHYFDNMLNIHRQFSKKEKTRFFTWMNDGLKMQIFCNSLESFLISVYTDSKMIKQNLDSEQVRRFHALVKIMRQKKNSNMTVKELAANAHISETTVKRLFFKYAGCGAHEYFLNIKLKEAYLLLEKGFRISEISEKLGFDSPNYFSVVFKRMTGYSPLNYKKKFLK